VGLLRRRPRHLHVLFLLGGSAVAVAFGAFDVLIGYRIVWSEVTPLRVWLYNLLIVGPPTAVALIPAVRHVEGAAARALLGVDLGEGPEPARTWSQRIRTVAWFWLHLLTGAAVAAAVYWGIVPGLLLMIQPLIVEPGSVIGGWSLEEGVVGGWAVTTGEWHDLRWPGLGLVLIIASAALTLACGSLLTALAPRLLGPTPEERLAALNARTTRLLERNRLARELHDSVGHALSLIVLQAAVARRRIGGQAPARGAALASLGAVEDAAQTALQDLDGVLGLLRDEDDAPPPQPRHDLTALPELIRAARGTGQQIELEVELDVVGPALPPTISKEAFRIVQEGLTNALRHAPDRPVTVRVRREAHALAIEVSNPVAATASGPSAWMGHRRSARKGGRGLTGIAERVRILGGELITGVRMGSNGESRWRITVTLPVPKSGDQS
jgi:signal transduction histidine kinase